MIQKVANIIINLAKFIYTAFKKSELQTINSLLASYTDFASIYLVQSSNKIIQRNFL